MPTKPEPSTAVESDARPTLMDIRDLRVHYELRGSALARLLGGGGATVKAVDGVNLALRRGEVLGLVGESGSGKTTLGRALLGLVPATAGHITYGGQDLAELNQRQLRPMRRRLQMVFQDPHAALNPSMDISTAVAHPLRIHGLVGSRAEGRARAAEAIERVGLVPAEQFLDKLPVELSGGQKQRAVIARAIICGPELLVADEPISMLDMSVRAKILELMLELRADLDLTYVYITHDLATAKFFCDRVAIMYMGRIVEIGPTDEIFADPKHPYTQALLRAVPDPDPERQVPRDLPRGEIADAAAPPHGCSFHPRCPYAFEPCGWEARDLRAMFERRWTELGEEVWERESALVGELDEIEGYQEQVRLKVGDRAPELVSLLDEARAHDPDEPLWRGVESIDSDDGTVTVRFRAGVDPALGPAGNIDVACHLHNPELRPK
ncbi:oligopeptide/dipeptide ABC transporter ATP-binding protein [Phytoactinopolyspora halotolerans]|uniref:oligopeptide/dipeptide ABC transporter ATP-binding protein n=1 Tax=Phytoactinopolyspora halotolerans TaxID=1981512 RepID=UPI001C203FA1|nr:ABC transporter ATP-binding protein [Phytoactinopolyspora halotolerans]